MTILDQVENQKESYVIAINPDSRTFAEVYAVHPIGESKFRFIFIDAFTNLPDAHGYMGMLKERDIEVGRNE